jgi:hypothetical protein
VESRARKPAFHSVVDLGLRDAGVKNNPRRLAAHFGKTSALLFALVFLSAIAICVIVGMTGAAALILAVLALAWTAGVFAVALRSLNRTPLVSVRVTAEGHERSTWLLLAGLLPLFALGALLAARSEGNAAVGASVSAPSRRTRRAASSQDSLVRGRPRAVTHPVRYVPRPTADRDAGLP